MEEDRYQTGSNALIQIIHIREKEPAISVKRLVAAREAGMIAAWRRVIAREDSRGKSKEQRSTQDRLLTARLPRAQ